MTKIAEQWTVDEGKLWVKETHDWNPVLEKAQALRSSGLVGDREKKLAGLIPMALWREWAKEAGIALNDPAMKDVVARKLNDPDNAHLRVWSGRF